MITLYFRSTQYGVGFAFTVPYHFSTEYGIGKSISLQLVTFMQSIHRYQSYPSPHKQDIIDIFLQHIKIWTIRNGHGKNPSVLKAMLIECDGKVAGTPLDNHDNPGVRRSALLQDYTQRQKWYEWNQHLTNSCKSVPITVMQLIRRYQS